MPFLSEAASAIKSRFGFQDPSSNSESAPPVPSVRSSPDLLKSVSKESLSSSTSSAVRRVGERVNFGEGAELSQSFEFREDPSFWKDHNVQVIIRIRPLSSSEISLQGHSKCIRQESCQTVTWTGHPESRFTFDFVADEHVSQEMLFKVAGVPMVENCVGGYNSCMFAYGQTGSGKTHTMLGDIDGGAGRHSVNCGMTPRVFDFLFSRIQKEKEARREEKLKFTCKCSFLEIYNEQILDLLDPSSLNLQVREDIKKGVYVENLTEVEVTSARDVIQQLVQGSANRKVAATNMNRASSRSHSVFTCIIESKWESQGVTHHRFARLNLVDLAGSERQKSSGADGERLKEATNINKSLSTLGLVIMNLVSLSNGKSLHVPYRDSKLTFLLQDSLGGNSKTIIIANISPSNSCSLETLSTLKFAQRAKFIKNHAIVNEDASGDVLAMRMQIQQLKKEVSRLRSMVNGGADNSENDALVGSNLGSPGPFKLDEFQGLFSPLASSKKISHKKEYEAALVAAFRREKDKDVALQALKAENEAAMQLAKQREDEIQGLKMRLRFREAGIKRLEVVASGKISAETHFLEEKEEHMKEIELLRTQVDRNQEVTRFAMENLRLKEEIRRLKSFCEEGERERMNEQVMILQDQLLEALDWKLKHESDLSVQKGSPQLARDTNKDDNLLFSSQDPASPWRTSINEENEFLRLQAIQNQSEMDALRKKLDFCLAGKENLERQVKDLEIERETAKSAQAVVNDEDSQKLQIEFPSLATDHTRNSVALNDQIELQTMVDAIAAASQREAEAHETAIFLSKENDELKMKLKVLIEDNNKLIELYEKAAAENSNNKTQNSQICGEEDKNSCPGVIEEKELDVKKEVENLEYQLAEMHEENEKLMSLYEKAMQERDELKRMICSSGERSVEHKGESSCPEKLVEVDEGKCKSNKHSIDDDGNFVRTETCFSESFVQDEEKNMQSQILSLPTESKSGLFDEDVHGRYSDENAQPNDIFDVDELSRNLEAKCVIESSEKGEEAILCHESSHLDIMNPSIGCIELEMEKKLTNVFVEGLSEDLSLVRMKMDDAQEKLLNSTQTVILLGSLERAIFEADKLSEEIEELEVRIQVKQQEHLSTKLLSSQLLERKDLIDKKLTALKCSLWSFSSSMGYFENREAQARTKVSALLSCLNQKKEELSCLEVCKDEIEDSKKNIQQSEVELKNKLANLKLQIEDEDRRRENEKVLFAIDDNIEKTEVQSLQRILNVGGKASDLLKSEEEKTKIQIEMKQARERLGIMRREIEDLDQKIRKLESKMRIIQMETEQGSKSVKEMDDKLQSIIREKEMVLEMKENGKTEFENLILDWHQCMFEHELKQEEAKILEAELQIELKRIEELETAKATANARKSQLLEAMRCESTFVSNKIEEDLQSVRMSILELKSLLGNDLNKS